MVFFGVEYWTVLFKNLICCHRSKHQIKNRPTTGQPFGNARNSELLSKMIRHYSISLRGIHLVGIVLVSHSALLAQGLAEILQQITGSRLKVVPIQNNLPKVLGTTPQSIIEAIHFANSGKGVLVFADMGSSVLSVRALLSEGLLGNIEVVLADAPFVEGAVAAVASALCGSDLHEAALAANRVWLYQKTEDGVKVI